MLEDPKHDIPAVKTRATLVTVSKIKSAALRRTVIVLTFVPMLTANIVCVGIAAVKGLFRNITVVFSTAVKHW